LFKTAYTHFLSADPEIRNCAAFFYGPNCDECGCYWEKHLHSLIEYETATVEKIDKNVKAEIKNKKQAIAVIEKKIAEMNQLVSEYQEELKIIQEVGSKFAYLLNAHSNMVIVISEFTIACANLELCPYINSPTTNSLRPILTC